MNQPIDPTEYDPIFMDQSVLANIFNGIAADVSANEMAHYVAASTAWDGGTLTPWAQQQMSYYPQRIAKSSSLTISAKLMSHFGMAGGIHDAQKVREALAKIRDDRVAHYQGLRFPDDVVQDDEDRVKNADVDLHAAVYRSYCDQLIKRLP